MDSEKRSANFSNTSFSSNFLTTAPSSIGARRTKTEVGEINTFGAERYFSMKLDENSPRSIDCHACKHGLKKDYFVDLPNIKSERRTATPSLSSESSWNSQAALFASFNGQPFQSTEKKVE